MDLYIFFFTCNYVKSHQNHEAKQGQFEVVHASQGYSKVNWGNSGHGVTPNISSFQACNSDKKKRIAFRLGVKTVLLLTFL